MRSLLLILTALLLSVLSATSGAAVGNAHAGVAQGFETERETRSMASAISVLPELDAVEALALPVEPGIVVAPGDDGLLVDEALDAPPPGYCNIWSADLLDPLDVLDELEESSALFALPTVQIPVPAGDISSVPARPVTPQPAALFKPPILRA
jgi:hypothetical protein